MATSSPRPRVGVPHFGLSGCLDEVRDAGGEPVPFLLPSGRPEGGVALVREWVADLAEISYSSTDLDALLVCGESGLGRGELLGLVLAGLRLNLPTIATDPVGDVQLRAALVALGVSPLGTNPAEVVVEAARGGGPRLGGLIESFSLANALRAGCSLGGDAEMIVHLAALAREADVAGFPQMIRVLVPETPPVVDPGSAWFAEHGLAGLLARVGDALHDTRTVAGSLREVLPAGPAPPAPPARPSSRLAFARGRASGTEILCRVPRGAEEVAGECYVYRSEEAAARAVEGGFVWPGSLLVVGGYGPRGGPGLRRLDRLGRALDEHSEAASMSVLTDGLPPAQADGNWFSLFSPEAASGGVIGRLRDGDTLRIDLAESRIRTVVGAEELENRRPWKFEAAGRGYAARYARSALPALEGAGFG